MDSEGHASVTVVNMLLAIIGVLFMYNAWGIWTWLRTAWILRKLPSGSGNPVYGGLLKMLDFNRIRTMEKVNEAVVEGSGVYYFNILWRQVCMVINPTEFKAASKRLCASA